MRAGAWASKRPAPRRGKQGQDQNCFKVQKVTYARVPHPPDAFIQSASLHTLPEKEDGAIANGNQDEEKEKGPNRDRVGNPGRQSRE